MMDKLLDKTMAFLHKNQEMDEDTSDIVRYGLELFLIKTTFSVVMLILGALLHSFWECLVFTVFFYLIRSLAGGYHADTRLKCFLQSILTFVTVILIIKVVKAYAYAIYPLLAFAVIAVFLVWLLAPIDTENKRLDDEEVAEFRKKSRVMLAIETAVAVVAFVAGFTLVSSAVMLSLIVTAVLLLIEHIKNKHAIN